MPDRLADRSGRSINIEVRRLGGSPSAFRPILCLQPRPRPGQAGLIGLFRPAPDLPGVHCRSTADRERLRPRVHGHRHHPLLPLAVSNRPLGGSGGPDHDVTVSRGAASPRLFVRVRRSEPPQTLPLALHRATRRPAVRSWSQSQGGRPTTWGHDADGTYPGDDRLRPAELQPEPVRAADDQPRPTPPRASTST